MTTRQLLDALLSAVQTGAQGVHGTWLASPEPGKSEGVECGLVRQESKEPGITARPRRLLA